MSRSSRSRRQSGSRKWLWVVPLVAIVAVLIAGISATVWAKRYLRSDAFRQFLAQRVSSLLQVDGEFAPFSWTDASVYSESFRGRGQTLVEKVDAQGIRATVDFGSFKREAWEVEQVSINRLQLNLGQTERAKPSPPSVNGPAPETNKPFWSRWIPQEVDLGQIQIAEVDYQMRGEALTMKGENLVVTLSPMSGDEGWSLSGGGGSFTAGDRSPVKVDRLHARMRGGEFFVTDAGFEVLDHAILTTTGDVEFASGALSFHSHLDQLKADRVLRADWKQRLLGTIQADIETKGSYRETQALKHKGTVRLKNGILMALPVLEKLADYTRTERFRRLVLNEAMADIRLEEDEIQLEKLFIRSDGLLQVTGSLTVGHPFDDTSPRPLSGVLEVGVVRDVLKWLPGVEKRVFKQERLGYMWTTMRVGGTVEAPTEDLTPRLGQALVVGTIEVVPETAIGAGRGLLNVASGVLGPDAGGLLDQVGNEVLDNADGVIKEGLGMVPMLDLGAQ